jgi:hypothetical protein
MATGADRVEEDYASYRLLVKLWQSENPIKTAKFLVLLGVNALLLAAAVLSGGLVPRNMPLFLAGAAFSFLLVLSLGRTTLFQEGWRRKIRELEARYPDIPRFQVLDLKEQLGNAPLPLRILGSVPSAFYLLGTPVILTLCWTGLLLSTLF